MPKGIIEVKYCNKCGNQMNGESKFCNKCGAESGTVINDLEVPTEQPIPNSISNNLQTKQLQYTNPKGSRVILMVILWVLFLPIMAIIYILKSEKLKKRLKAVLIIAILLFCIIIIYATAAGAHQVAQTTFNKIKITVDNKEYVKAQEQLNRFIKDYPNYKETDEAKVLLAQVNPEADKIKATEKALVDKAAADKAVSNKAAVDKAAADKAAADKAAADKAAADKAAAAKAASDKAAADKVAYDTGITYAQLARTPDNYKDKKVKFTGTVVQVVQGDNETDLRIAVNGSYDNILYVAYDPKISSTRILQNDQVTIKGVSQGIYTYKSTLGGNISIPLVLVDIITIN